MTGLSLLVSSCDAYADLWRPCFALIHRYWPDCTSKQYLLSNSLRFGDPRVETLAVGKLGSWSDEMAAALSQISSDHVLVMLDDFFLRRKVSNLAIERCLRFAQVNCAVSVRLIPRPGPTRGVPDERLVGECDPALPYRVCTQAAIWHRLSLLELLRPGESIWQFEHNAGERNLGRAHGFYSVKRPVLPYNGILSHHVVEKGQWLPHERWIFARQKIGCDFGARNTLPWPQTCLNQSVRLLDQSLDVLPWRTKVNLKRFLKRTFTPLLPHYVNQMSGLCPPANKPLGPKPKSR